MGGTGARDAFPAVDHDVVEDVTLLQHHQW